MEQEHKNQHFAGYSALQTYRDCPQRWGYEYLEGLSEPQNTKLWAVIGSWWSAIRMAHSLEKGSEEGTLIFDPRIVTVVDGWEPLDQKTITVAEVYRHIRNWEDSLQKEPFGETTLFEYYCETLGENPYRRLRKMDDMYVARWAEETASERVLGAEVEWQRAVPKTQGKSFLRGTIDQLVYDESIGGVILRDHKTHKAMPEDNLVLDNLGAGQLNIYAWGVFPALQKFDLRTDYIQFDRIRSKKPTGPVLTQAGSLSKSVTDYDVSTYVEWATKGPTYPGRKKDGSDGGTYILDPNVITSLSTDAAKDKWTRRITSLVNPRVVRAHLESAADTLARSQESERDWQKYGYAPRNFDRFRCDRCPFAKLCNDQILTGDPLSDLDVVGVYGLSHN